MATPEKPANPDSIWNDDLSWGGFMPDPIEDLWQSLEVKNEPVEPRPRPMPKNPEGLDWS